MVDVECDSCAVFTSGLCALGKFELVAELLSANILRWSEHPTVVTLERPRKPVCEVAF